MKKYVSCFLFFLVLTAGCLVSLFVLTIDPPRQQAAEVQMTESVEQPALAEGSGEEEMAHLVLNSGAGACKGQFLPGGGGGVSHCL